MERRLRRRFTSASLEHSLTDAVVANELLWHERSEECAPRRRRSTLSIDNSWNHVYNRLFTSESSAESMEFTAEYNHIAKKHGLLSISGADDEPRMKERRRWFRTVKKPIAYRLSDFTRLSGCSVLTLPAEVAVGPLVVPSCFAAMSTVILRDGRSCNGIFRIPGSASAVNDICDYYLQQLRHDSAIDATVTTVAYPARLSQSVHDIASAFKKLLSKISGGILGSAELFHALDGCVHLGTSPELSTGEKRDIQLRMFALALLSRDQHYRASLICSVFGLLSAIASETERVAAPQMMSAKSLSVVFGPLLLGEHLHIVDLGNHSLIDPPNSKLHQSAFMTMHVERLKRAAAVAEAMISNWKGIIRQIRLINEPKPSLSDVVIPVDPPVSKRSRTSISSVAERAATPTKLEPVAEAPAVRVLSPTVKNIQIPERGASLGSPMKVRMSGPVLHYSDGSMSGVAVFSVDKPLLDRANKPIRNTAMHAELRRMKEQLDQKTEECAQLRRELEALSRSKMSGNLPELRKELDSWKQRAEVAEKRLSFLEKPIRR